MPGPLLLLEEHVYDEACVLETAVMLSEISIIAGSKEILSVHHFTVFISPMRYAVVKVRGLGGLSPPAPIWAPCNSMSPLPDWIYKMLFYA